MLPVIPALVAGGLMKMIILLLGYTPLFGSFPDTKIILTAISDAPFYFLPFLVAWSSAVHFGTDIVSALCVAGSMVVPAFIALMQGEPAVSFAGIPVFKTTYSYTIFPVIITVWIMGTLEKRLKKVLKGTADLILSHLILILLSSLIGILAIGPAIGVLAKWILDFIQMLQVKAPILAWVVFDASAPLQIMTGTHWVFISLVLTNLGQYGMESGFMVGYFILTMSMTATCLAARIKTKNKEFGANALSAGLTVFFTGTTEPGLFGVCLINRMALIAAIAGGAAAGIFQGINGIHCYVYSFPTVFSILMFQSSKEPGNLMKAALAGLISFAVSFLVMMLFFKDEDSKFPEKQAETK